MSYRVQKADAFMLGLLRWLGVKLFWLVLFIGALLLIALFLRTLAPGEAGETIAGLFLLVPVVAGYIAWTWLVPAAWGTGIFLAVWLGYRNGPLTGVLGLCFLIALATVIHA
jgi:hypothetical protein